MATTNPDQHRTCLSETDVARFRRDGFLILRNLCGREDCQRMSGVVHASLDPVVAPVEYEAELDYPGAPETRDSPGGDTPRRLLNAFARDEVFRSWALSQNVASPVRRLLSSDSIQTSQNHHNCIMTKHPGFGSATGWHQDIRYWTFDQPDLITVWLALGQERSDNGGLLLIPGSHRMRLGRGQFDAALFIREDLEENRRMLNSACSIELNSGDALFFHSRLIHSAGRNHTDAIKLSVVFTYHASDNRPIAGTRSAKHPEIDL